MAFSPWQILSPVQWARWTWSAVRGGGAGEDEAGGPEGDPEDEDSQAETKSLSFRNPVSRTSDWQARGPRPKTHKKRRKSWWLKWLEAVHLRLLLDPQGRRQRRPLAGLAQSRISEKSPNMTRARSPS